MLTKTLGQEFETNILNIENLEGKMVLYFVDKNNLISNCGMLHVKIGCLVSVLHFGTVVMQY